MLYSLKMFETTCPEEAYSFRLVPVDISTG